MIRKLSADVIDILAMPDTKAKLETLGLELAPQGPKEFDAFIAAEVGRWSKVIKQAGIDPQ